ncbi:hypothetical protein A6R68_01644 [Neotoma lepida]|uniref:Uncharacterized protein n=1 Tax=Neotoma lepida TaxID=56216 RepID=A0A1A6GUG7_NEOLE|nr:hypothetical protein A6R68_01644 [Neotoma lepida]
MGLYSLPAAADCSLHVPSSSKRPGNIDLRLSQTVQTHHNTARHRKLEGFHLTIFPTVLFLPTENFQSSPFFRTECALQPSVPVLRNATPSAGRSSTKLNFSRVYTQAVCSAWLLPSDSSTCCQKLMDSAYPYQPAGTIMLTALTDQSQSSTSKLSYSGVLQWDLTGSTDRRKAAFYNFL